jgi:hypothetical protein
MQTTITNGCLITTVYYTPDVILCVALVNVPDVTLYFTTGPGTKGLR